MILVMAYRQATSPSTLNDRDSPSQPIDQHFDPASGLDEGDGFIGIFAGFPGSHDGELQHC